MPVKKEIIEFTYSFDGTIAGLAYSYELKKEGEDFFFSYHDKINGEDLKFQIETDASVMETLQELYEEYQLEKWKGFHESDPDIMDGSSFSLDLLFADGEALQAYGLNKYPESYAPFRKKMEALFQPLVEEFLAQKKQQAGRSGISGDLQYVLAIFEGCGKGGKDLYRFELDRNPGRGFSFRAEITAKEQGIFDPGTHQYYSRLPAEAIDFAGIEKLFEQYELSGWHKFDRMDESDTESEWFQLYFSFENGHISARGTAHPDHYEEFREAFLKLMAQNIETAKKEYGLEQYKE